jgi:uncharacterized protein
VVNNAGAATFGRLEDGEPAREQAVVRLNCEAVVGVTTALLPALVGGGAGILLNVASLAGVGPTPGCAVYGASKAFVVSLSRALREELRGSGVSVTALCPGPVASEFFVHNPAGMPRRAPRHELSVEDCVAAGLRGALAGKAVVVPGLLNRITAAASRLTPAALSLRVAGKVSLPYMGLPPLPPRPARRRLPSG